MGVEINKKELIKLPFVNCFCNYFVDESNVYDANGRVLVKTIRKENNRNRLYINLKKANGEYKQIKLKSLIVLGHLFSKYNKIDLDFYSNKLFEGERSGRFEIYHKDSDPTNCAFSNLRIIDKVKNITVTQDTQYDIGILHNFEYKKRKERKKKIEEEEQITPMVEDNKLESVDVNKSCKEEEHDKLLPLYYINANHEIKQVSTKEITDAFPFIFADEQDAKMFTSMIVLRLLYKNWKEGKDLIGGNIQYNPKYKRNHWIIGSATNSPLSNLFAGTLAFSDKESCKKFIQENKEWLNGLLG